MEKTNQLFDNYRCADILGVCIAGAIVSAKELGYTKLELQTLLVKMWDESRKGGF
jgi:hypothetical protein